MLLGLACRRCASATACIGMERENSWDRHRQQDRVLESFGFCCGVENLTLDFLSKAPWSLFPRFIEFTGYGTLMTDETAGADYRYRYYFMTTEPENWNHEPQTCKYPPRNIRTDMICIGTAHTIEKQHPYSTVNSQPALPHRAPCS